MDRQIIIIILCGLSQIAMAQSASVERSIFGIQAGWGIWVHQEAKLSPRMALRSEIGVHARVRGGNIYEKPKFVMSPVLTLEPRWYYNLNNRLGQGKRIDGNSGNFLAVKSSWHPDWFGNSTINGVNDLTDISLVPTWGMRRLIGNHFTFETGIGIGCRLVFGEYIGVRENNLEGVLHLNVRLGFGAS
jgi:hypothetical protein